MNHKPDLPHSIKEASLALLTQSVKALSTQPLFCADPKAMARIAALWPGGEVACRISHGAYRRLVNFDRRGGPEPDWYRFKKWDAELGEMRTDSPCSSTPEEEAEEQKALDAYWDRWNESLEERDALIIHTLCAAMETAERDAAGGLLCGTVRFHVPTDLPYKHDDPLVELTAWCEPTDTAPDAAPSVSLVIACENECR